VNRTVNPEAQVADRVASLLGTTLTEADVHRFLLDAAGILGTESFAAYGPDLRFRWRVGERAVEIEPDYGSLTGELSLRVDSFNPAYPIENDEYRSFERVDAADYPYLWTVELGRLFRGGFEDVGREGRGGGLLGRALLVRRAAARAPECVSRM